MGIYGSNDWGGPGPTPIGSPGLVRFNPDLEIDWVHPGGSSIDNCEALALVNDSVWIYHYSDYPVVDVQADGGRPPAWWPVKPDRAPDGVHTLAVAGTMIGLVGGYADKEAGRVLLIDLNGDEWTRRQTVQLVLPNGHRPTHQTQIYGLDDTFHLFDNRNWYIADLTACLD